MIIHTLYGTLNNRPLFSVLFTGLFLFPRNVTKKKLLVCVIFKPPFRICHEVCPDIIYPVLTRPAIGPCGPVGPVAPVGPVGPVAPVGPSIPSKFTL